MNKTTLFYVVTLVLAGLAVASLLRLGADLPAPTGLPHGEGIIASAAKTIPQAEVAEASGIIANPMFEGLRANFHHPLSHLFIQLLVIITASRFVGGLFARCGQPAVVGEMIAGILLGPSLLGFISPGALSFIFPESSLGTLKLLSQVGVSLFMFSVGMELNFGQVRNKVHAAVVISHVSIFAPYLLGIALSYFLYSSLAQPGSSFTPFALFIGISMSITAFPMLARILQERNMAKTFLGNTAITCAAVDDVTAWSALAFVVAIARATSLASSIFNLALVILFIGVMIGGVRRLLPKLIGSDELALQDPSKRTLAIVLCAVIAAALCTEVMGVHALFGAFLAGAIMPETSNFRHKLGTQIENFSSVLLLPLFFAFTGLRTEIGLLSGAQDWLLCLLIIVIATLGKLGGSSLAARFTGMNWRDSLQIGALMNTRGLMELIALNIGYDLGILSPRIFTMLVIMAIVTTVFTGPLLTLFGRIRTEEKGAPEAPSPEVATR